MSGGWVVKKGMKFVYVVIEWPLMSIEIDLFVANFTFSDVLLFIFRNLPKIRIIQGEL